MAQRSNGRYTKNVVKISLLVAFVACTPLCTAFGPDQWPLETILGESQQATITAIQEELQPLADQFFGATGLNSDCVANAVGLLGGCWGDAVQFLQTERANIMNIAGQNPLVYLQPTSQSLIQAAAEDMDGRSVSLSDGCCSRLTTLSDDACMCSSTVIDLLRGMTGDSFMSTLQISYLESCGGSELVMAPSDTCDALLSAGANETQSEP